MYSGFKPFATKTFFFPLLFFAIIILFLGLRHPPPLNDITKIGIKRQLVGVVVLIILLTTFVPVPIVEIMPDHSFDINVHGSNNTTAYAGDIVFFNMTVNNTGNTNIDMQMSVVQVPSGWQAVVYLSNRSAENSTNILHTAIEYNGSRNITLRIVVSGEAPPSSKVFMLESASQDRLERDYFTVNVIG